MAEKIKIDPLIAEMLLAAQKIFASFNIDFYLIGAAARDIQFSGRPELASLRKTNDVDIALMIADEGQFYEIKNALVATGLFTAHEIEPIKLFYKQAIEIDLLPFGDIENEAHEIRLHKPRLFVMDMPGFQEVLSYRQEFIIDDNLKLYVCPLEGLVLLKLFANNDRPGRTKDISDIELIIRVYFDIHDDEIYNSDIMEHYDPGNLDYLSLVASRMIGRKMKVMLSTNQTLMDRMILILRNRPTEEWDAITEGFTE